MLNPVVRLVTQVILQADSGKIEILDCRKSGEHHLHIGRVISGEIQSGQKVTAAVDSNVRQGTALNHSATHLMHAALQQVLGDHVVQKGSLVDSERLRFDFSHNQAVTPEQLRQIEHRVNREILRNSQVNTQVMSMDDAKTQGAMALFGEKYGDQVRVLSMGGDFSVELCGGTHVSPDRRHRPVAHLWRVQRSRWCTSYRSSNR